MANIFKHFGSHKLQRKSFQHNKQFETCKLIINAYFNTTNLYLIINAIKRKRQ